MAARRNAVRRTLWVPALVIALISMGESASADLVWEDYYTDEQSILDGTVLSTPSGIDVTIDRLVFSDSDGGTFDLTLYDNADFFTFEAGLLGGHTGLLESTFNNQNDDPADYLELTLTFSSAVVGLQFSLLDVDSGSWDDGVEVFYNGNLNVRNNPALYALGAANGLDNEPGMHGFEGLGTTVSSSQTLGNIDFDFGEIAVTTLRIRYFSTDDADRNPGGQRIGISDLRFGSTVDEPPATGMICVFAVIAAVAILRRRSGVWGRRALALLTAVPGRRREAHGRLNIPCNPQTRRAPEGSSLFRRFVVQ